MRKPAFTLIELLVVIAIIAILAAILFPVFAQARERARMSACVSNMRQIGASLMMYVQDYDETYPYCRFHGALGTAASTNVDSWRNAILPYLKNLDVLGCPSNPFSRTTSGVQGAIPPKRGANAEGWERVPEQRMPISYNMNQCASSWVPADSKNPAPPPPLRLGQLARPAETIIVGETTWATSDFGAEWLWNDCPAIFTHSAGRTANFVFFDGHAKNKTWMSTLYPVTQNNWEPVDHPDPNNLNLSGAPPCTYAMPKGPDAKEFQKPECLAYR